MSMSSIAMPRRPTAGLLALVFALGSAIGLAQPQPVAAWSGGSFSSTSERQLISMTNQARASAGLRSLRIDSTLTQIARWRSHDMSVRNYFSHQIPGYGMVFDKLSAVGYCYKLAGENIGWNTYPDDSATAEIQSQFMGSSPHRANILGRTWDAIGVGAYKEASGKKFWTVLFADRCGSAPVVKHPTATKRPVTRKVAVVRPRPVIAARPTPRPTPKPTPAPTPTPTPVTPQLANPFDPSLLATPAPSGEPITAAVDPGPSAPSGAGATGLRVVDRAPSGGLVETIVGGVTGSFFGT